MYFDILLIFVLIVLLIFVSMVMRFFSFSPTAREKMTFNLPVQSKDIEYTSHPYEPTYYATSPNPNIATVSKPTDKEPEFRSFYTSMGEILSDAQKHLPDFY